MKNKGWNKNTSPYHAGEQELHNRLGRKDIQENMGRRIHRPYLLEQHREFFSQLPFIIAGTIDDNGWPWASILLGEPGFISTPDDKTLKIETKIINGDRIENHLKPDAPIGFLGIDLATRRRNRMNGVVQATDDKSIQVDVVQSYGNCPQYIQSRDLEFTGDAVKTTAVQAQEFSSLDHTATDLIQNADTLFVASHNHRDNNHDTGGADASHRGGRPGFVKVEGNVLTIPDYSGNNAFNTLGNFLVNPKAGLLFIDFENGDLWQLTGTVKLVWKKTKELSAFPGAERAWQFTLVKGTHIKQALPVVWTYKDASPMTLGTGSWRDVS